MLFTIPVQNWPAIIMQVQGVTFMPYFCYNYIYRAWTNNIVWYEAYYTVHIVVPLKYLEICLESSGHNSLAWMSVSMILWL